MTLRDLPPINGLAEARITERYTLAHALTMMHGTIPGGYVRDRAIDVAVELNLLCDLTRPDSRDAVARLVASKMNREGWQVTQAIEDCGVELLVLCEDAHVDWSAMETASVADVLTTIAFAVLA